MNITRRVVVRITTVAALVIGLAFLAIPAWATPITCTNPDTGAQTQGDNPLGGLPFISGLGSPDGCTNGQTLAGQAVDGVMGPGTWAKSVADAVKTMSTFWLSTPSPTVADPDTHVITGPAAQLQTNLLWLTLLVMMACIAFKGAQIAWAGARGGEPLGELIKGVVDWLIAACVVAGVVGVVLVGTDGMSQWLVDQSTTGSDFATNLNAFLDNPDAVAGIPEILGYGLMGLALFFSFLQLLVFAGRSGGLVVVLGVYLLSASTASLRQGRRGHGVLTAWLIGFCLYKLAAACVYSGAFLLMGTPAGNANATWSIMTGIALEVLSIFTLYALIKMAMPATEPVAGHGFIPSITTAGMVVR